MSVPQAVIAVLLTSKGRIALLRRSREVSHDHGLWHCVTGYLPHGMTPWAQALDELREEVGLEADRLMAMRVGPVLRLWGTSGDEWVVHTFACELESTDLTLNWEHDAQVWVDPGEVPGDNQVAWLVDVVDAFRSSDHVFAPPGSAGRHSPRKAAHGHQ